MLLDLAQLLPKKFSDEGSVGDAEGSENFAQPIPIAAEETNLPTA
jgi:hypothetical protein